MRRNPVVGQADVAVGRGRRQEAKLPNDVVPHGQGHVEMTAGRNERMAIVTRLVAEHLVDVASLLGAFGKDVVEHGVVAGVVLDDLAHRANLVGVVGGLHAPIGVQLGGQRRGNPHELMGDDEAPGVRGLGPKRANGGQPRLGQAHVHLIVPALFVARGVDAESLVEMALQGVQRLCRGAPDVDQDHLRALLAARDRIAKQPPTVDDLDAVALLNLAEALCIGPGASAVQRGVEHLALGAEPGVGITLGGEQRAEQDGAVDGGDIVGGGEQALQHGADAPDLGHGLVGYVDDVEHRLEHPCDSSR